MNILHSLHLNFSGARIKFKTEKTDKDYNYVSYDVRVAHEYKKSSDGIELV